MTKKEKTAQVIRGITVPPILVAILIIILSFTRDDIFRKTSEQLISILLLGVIPALAYLFRPQLSQNKDNRRNGQRNLAFILNMTGYTLAFIYGYLLQVEKNLMLIYLTYFFSVMILTFVNKVIRIRASGHACSATGPLLILLHFIGGRAVLF